MWVALDSGGGFRLVPSSWSIDWNNQCLYWKVNIMITFGIRNSVHVLPEAFLSPVFCCIISADNVWLCGGEAVVIGGV